MSAKKRKLLIVDDNKNILTALTRLLEMEVDEVHSASNPNLIHSMVRLNDYDAILLDMNFSASVQSGNEGLFWMKEILKIDPNAVVIPITAYGDVDLAVKAVKEGAADIDPDVPVSGLNWYEADAYAHYAGARLPHEIEWESAMKTEGGKGATELWDTTGQAWEWCANTFYPYDGFKAFPYSRYSTPWFDDQHFTLRGSSPFTGEATRRPSFRNFYQPGKRHIFAGLRLASDY